MTITPPETSRSARAPLRLRVDGASSSSAIRDLLEQAQRPGMISLAGGLPDAERFPTSELSSIAARVLEHDGERVLQYGATDGDVATRRVLGASLFDGVGADDLIVTTGSQQGLDLVARVLLDPGDVVVVGDPDYVGVLQVLRSHRAKVVPIPMDENGLDIDRLAQLLAAGLGPKALYLVPHFHNPTGATMTKERRHHLDGLALRHGMLIIEDDPYRQLHHDGPAPRPDHPHELTVRLRSTSKILAPGLRIGAMSGPRWLLDAVAIAKQGVDLHTSTLCQAIVTQALDAPWFADHLAGLRAAYGAKATALLDALSEAFDDRVVVSEPAGGMFLWARFDGIDTTTWLNRCLDSGVCFVPGPAFAVERDLRPFARFSFATASVDELRIAATRMAAAC